MSDIASGGQTLNDRAAPRSRSRPSPACPAMTDLATPPSPLEPPRPFDRSFWVAPGKLLDERIAGGEVVYVHCWGGRGRTGTAAGCWLARHGMAEGDEVLALLQHLRRREGALELPVPPEKSQRNFVVRWRAGE